MAKKSKKTQLLYRKSRIEQSRCKVSCFKEINLVGIDSPSIDLGNNESFSVHHIFAKKDILIVENLANLRINFYTYL